MRERTSSARGLFQVGVELPGEDTDQDGYPQNAPYQSEGVEHPAAEPEHQPPVGDGVDVGSHAGQQDRVPIGDAAYVGPEPDGPRHRGRSG